MIKLLATKTVRFIPLYFFWWVFVKDNSRGETEKSTATEPEIKCKMLIKEWHTEECFI